MLDSGQSPQPQIRIRKEPFKQQNMPSSLAKFEEKLMSGGADSKVAGAQGENSPTSSKTPKDKNGTST